MPDPFVITNPAVNPKVGTGSGIDILQLFLSNFITLALGAAGIISFFMLLWGGIEYITAGGDKERTQSAAKRLTAALIGLAIVFSVFAIIFVVETRQAPDRRLNRSGHCFLRLCYNLCS